MKRKWFVKGLMLAVVLLTAYPSWAAHPLITDDTGTQGKGNFQLELNGQYDWDKEDSEGVVVKSRAAEAAVTLSYGILKNIDLVVSLPYIWGREKEDDVTVYDENGIGDAALEAKWRLLEKEGFSLALKPGISIPTGDDDKGLGTGKVGGQIFLIATEEIGSWAFHGNLGYIRNENDADEIKDIWHVSLAAQYEVIKDLNLVANIGMERNPDDEADDDPAFIIGGVIYSINDNLDVDLGVKCGLTDTETDISALTGVAFRF